MIRLNEYNEVSVGEALIKYYSMKDYFEVEDICSVLDIEDALTHLSDMENRILENFFRDNLCSTYFARQNLISDRTVRAKKVTAIKKIVEYLNCR